MSLDEDKRGNRRAAKQAGGDLDVTELEKRVHIAELHAREAEAEVRYLKAATERKQLRVSRTGHGGAGAGGGGGGKKEGRRARRQGGGGDDDD